MVLRHAQDIENSLQLRLQLPTDLVSFQEQKFAKLAFVGQDQTRKICDPHDFVATVAGGEVERLQNHAFAALERIERFDDRAGAVLGIFIDDHGQAIAA